MTMRWVFVGALMLVGASAASAADIEGKWGVSAGLFSSGGEISLLRGTSEDTAWLLDLSAFQREGSYKSQSTLDTTVRRFNSNGGRVTLGPRMRRFTRATSDFSPYWDVFLHGLYSRSHDNFFSLTSRQDLFGAEGGLAFGLEYATPWHCSIAAHSGLASVSWVHFKNVVNSPLVEETRTGHDQSAMIGISPALYVRAYF